MAQVMLSSSVESCIPKNPSVRPFRKEKYGFVKGIQKNANDSNKPGNKRLFAAGGSGPPLSANDQVERRPAGQVIRLEFIQ